jgi:UDP-glucose 4-epimerase
MDERFVITGGVGFVGSHLSKHLVSQGRVLRIDRKMDLGAEDGCEMMIADLRQGVPDAGDYEHPIVIHSAAVLKAENLRGYWKDNVDGTRNILDWSLKKGAKHFVYISTGGVYGYNKGKHMKERDSVSPIGAYGYTKYIGENVCLMYSKLHGLAVTVIRLYFPYGPKQKGGIFPLICKSVLEGTQLTIKRGGAPCINPVHIGDLVDAISKSMLNGSGFRIYNLCGDEAVSFLDLTSLFERVLGRRANVVSTEEDEGDLLGDNSLIKQDLGWQPKRTLLEGISEFTAGV